MVSRIRAGSSLDGGPAPGRELSTALGCLRIPDSAGTSPVMMVNHLQPDQTGLNIGLELLSI